MAQCIRVMADSSQLDECRKVLKQHEGQFSRLSKILRLAGNEVRLKILYLIYSEEQMCVCDLSDVLNMKVPAISQHLRKLKDGGILKDKKVGQTIFYSLIEDNMEVLRPLFQQIEKQDRTTTYEHK
jgi:ArsR family transcriptional regulator, lead/cadmium/zinc/bismuth-responsive transcriptional repressor